jgi:hypothetical protein
MKQLQATTCFDLLVEQISECESLKHRMLDS